MSSRAAHAGVRLVALAFVLAALTSFVTLPHVPWTFSAPILTIGLLTAWRPLDGLLIAATLLPVATVTSQLAGTHPFKVVDVVALTVIGGWLARTAFDRSWPVPPRVARPALLFACLVIASMLVELAVVQIQRDYPLPFLRGFLSWLTQAYVSDYSSFRSLHEGALLLEGVALFTAAAAVCRRIPSGAGALSRMLVVGATAAAALNVVRLLTSAVRTGTPLEALRVTLQWVRLNIHFGDVNAAGSQFTLALLIACGLLAVARRWRVGWVGSVALLTVGLWLTRSRMAWIGLALAFSAWAVISLGSVRSHVIGRRRVLMMAAVPLVVAALVTVVVAVRIDRDFGEAINIRLGMARVAAEMTRSHPVFGIGVGRFYPESAPLIPERLRQVYVNENAHNNFLQIAAELGIAGLIAFTWLLATALHPAVSDTVRLTHDRRAVLFGVLGFIVTALGGHPLLIAEVALTFWLALAVCCVFDVAPPDPVERTPRSRLMTALLVIIVLSVVPRAALERWSVDLENVTHGLSEWRRTETGERYRAANDEATFFVSRDAWDPFRLELPLRTEARGAPLRIEIDGDRVLALQMAPGVWRTYTVIIPARPNALARVTVNVPGAFMTGPPRLRRIGPRWKWGDVDGDRRADLTVFRPGTTEWLTSTSSSNHSSYVRSTFGVATDVPVARDYDGDAKQDVAVYRPSSATWFIQRAEAEPDEFATVQWGLAGDLPVPADYDGDEKADLAIYRPSDGTWAIQASSTKSLIDAKWGAPDDIPVPADYDGDSRAEIAVYRPATGSWLIRDPSGRTHTEQLWGIPGDIPVPADYDGDARIDVAVFRPSRGTWLVLLSSDRTTMAADFGLPGDIPMPADFDGDRRDDLTVYRPSDRRWYVRNVLQRDWGEDGDVPVPRR